MKIKINEEVDTTDIPALMVGLYHTSKRVDCTNKSFINKVEHDLKSQAEEAFSVYFNSFRDNFIEMLEKTR